LLCRLGDVDGIEWVRLMCAYPAKFPREVLGVLADHPHVCKYMDMPVQHISDPVLRSMRRGISRRAVRELIHDIRSRVPLIALRTTLIVGYPDEGEKEFLELLDFVNEVKFDRLGVFTYSREEGTAAYDLGDPIPAAEKERRRSAIMKAQQAISEQKNQLLINTTQRILLDRMEDGVYVGRTERDAPEIDNEVFVRTARHVRVGDFVEVAIDDASEYDLFGSLLEERNELNLWSA
jgi:ribosomal protein S12 methylthiotransferase